MNFFVGESIMPMIIESLQEAVDLDAERDFKITKFTEKSLYES